MKRANKPDLDLISMVQRARMQNDDAAIPSQVAAVYWIETVPEVPVAAPTSRAGRWVIRTTVDQVDDLWMLIKRATKAGRLGYKSKVSTAARDMGKDQNDRVIHVVTYDADDTADVERVRAALLELGVSASIEYERTAEK